MTPKKTNTTKWICGTILIIFFMTWSTVVLIPLGLLASFKKIAERFLNPSNNVQKKVVYKPYVPTKVETKKNITPRKDQVKDRFLYIVYLQSGGTMKASEITNEGNIYLLKNNNGLVMSVSKSDIQQIKKVRL